VKYLEESAGRWKPNEFPLRRGYDLEVSGEKTLKNILYYKYETQSIILPAPHA
jgi:hypothetical protein